MRRSWVPLFITLFVVAMLVVGFFLRWPDFAHNTQVERVVNGHTAMYQRLTIRYDHPPIYEERWDVQDVDGTSSAQYKATGYSGKVVTNTMPPERTTLVPFFLERVVADGIWDLTNRRGSAGPVYTLYIKQFADNKQGERTIVFTDPHYWAVTAGRQFHIHLDPKKPTPNLLTLNSTSLADPRYEQIVREFQTFGSPSFLAKVRQARELVSSSH